MENSNFHNVLLVDDTSLNLDILINILGDEYDISVATDGPGALDYIRQNQPDLILLDVMMPGMSGYDVCRELKSNISTRNIPVIFVTAMSEIEDEALGFELGAVDYITKPVSPSIVKARVRTQLALYDQNKEMDRKVQIKTRELNETRLEIIQQLGRAAEFKDHETGTHVIRIGIFSKIIGLASGFSEEHAELLLNAAPMHDVGKIGIPDHILKKPGKLNDAEWELMKQHTAIGANILGNPPSELLQLAKIIAFTHHEKWNGKGYPQELIGVDIPIESRIVAIADVFDALTSERPYKKCWCDEKAIAVINAESGEHFDPALVQAFQKCLPQIIEIKNEYSEV